MSTAAEIAQLQQQIATLEEELEQVRTQLQEHKRNDPHASRVYLPNTALLSENFLTRAFAVYGHTLVASLFIAVPLYCIVFLIQLASH